MEATNWGPKEPNWDALAALATEEDCEALRAEWFEVREAEEAEARFTEREAEELAATVEVW